MSVSKLSVRKRIGLEVFKRLKANYIKEHKLDYLVWECTLRCNLACKHCGSDCHKNMRQIDMPANDFLKAIDSITPYVDTHKTMIVITGGEPLMRDDLEFVGKELYKRQYPWGMVTNGLAMTRERLIGLINSGLRSVTVSLDGLEASHNAIRGNSKSFENAFATIQWLVEFKEHLVFDVVTCLTPRTLPELEELKSLLINAGVEAWRIFSIFPIGRANQNDELQLPPTEFKAMFDFIKATRIEGMINLSYGCEGFLGNYETEVRDNFFFCRAGVTIGSILVDGSISACPNLRSNFIQGNIYKDDFMDVWNNAYQIFRNREWAKKGKCADCKSFRYCEGNGMHLRDENGNLLFCHLERLKEAEK